MSVAVGIAVVAVTEILSVFHALRRVPLAIFWAIVLVAVVFYLRRLPWRTRLQLPRIELFLLALLVGIFAVVGVTALASAPNNYDSMTYHLPRMARWAQDGSVGHYGTGWFNQNAWPWFADGVLAHIYILTGSDRFLNLFQFFALIGSALSASLLVRHLGASPRGQMCAAVLVATIPMAILQGSSTQGHLVMAFWIVTAAALLVDPTFTPWQRALWVGGALGLAALTHTTALLFGAAIAVWYVVRELRQRGWTSIVPIAAAGVVALAIIAPHYGRNWSTYGSPVASGGEEQVVGRYGWDVTVSNIVRNAALHTVIPSTHLDADVTDYVVRAIHKNMLGGLSVSDPQTRKMLWAPVDNWDRHEDTQASTFHVLLIALALLAVVARRHARARGLAGSIVLGGILFCAVLRWQPFNVRLHLPLLVLGAALVALVFERLRSGTVLASICVALTVLAIPFLVGNRSRPLFGSRSVLTSPRTQVLFNNRPASEQPTLQAAKQLTGCLDVGLKIRWPGWEYPLWVLTRSEGTKFHHVLVPDASRLLETERAPCAVFESPPGQKLPTISGRHYEPVFSSREAVVYKPKGRR